MSVNNTTKFTYITLSADGQQYNAASRRSIAETAITAADSNGNGLIDSHAEFVALGTTSLAFGDAATEHMTEAMFDAFNGVNGSMDAREVYSLFEGIESVAQLDADPNFARDYDETGAYITLDELGQLSDIVDGTIAGTTRPITRQKAFSELYVQNHEAVAAQNNDLDTTFGAPDRELALTNQGLDTYDYFSKTVDAYQNRASVFQSQASQLQQAAIMFNQLGLTQVAARLQQQANFFGFQGFELSNRSQVYLNVLQNNVGITMGYAPESPFGVPVSSSSSLSPDIVENYQSFLSQAAQRFNRSQPPALRNPANLGPIANYDRLRELGNGGTTTNGFLNP